MRVISPTVARRMAITGQRLAGARPSGDADGILGLIRHLGCVQLDPIGVVAPSHRLVLWSRLGAYDRSALDTLQWEERRLFEYWAHAASIVLTEDYPIHRRTMRLQATGSTSWSRRFQGWVEENAALRTHVLRELRRHGPMPARAFEDRSVRAWASSGWTSGRNVDRMLAYLWISGKLAVARRVSGNRWWDLAERWLPKWTPRDRLSEAEVGRRAAQRALRALGVARPIDIQRHFIRDHYPDLPGVLRRLQRDGIILPVQIKDGGAAWPGTWFVHADDADRLDRLEAGEWEPRTTLLSPFDNLICDRARTRLLFGFDFSIEIYVPAAKRRYGYYVLSILHGDRLVGRIDTAVDRRQQQLMLRAVHAEGGAPSREAGPAIAEAVASLAAFTGARSVAIGPETAAGWKGALRRAL